MTLEIKTSTLILMPKRDQKGFTLIELLLVIGIIAVLAIVVFVALNPAQRFKDTRNARRASDVETILTAIHSSIVDNKGTLPSALATASAGVDYQLGTTGGCQLTSATQSPSCNVTTSGCLDLLSSAGAQNLAKYLQSVPVDPSGYAGNVSTTPDSSASATKTNYAVSVDANGIITVKACVTEASNGLTRAATATISTSR